MKMLRSIPILAALSLLSGCVTVPPKDYTAYRASKPRSILVLPPVNESTEIGATYSVLTTTTMPIAELGYYVMPIGIVDRFMKENGLTVPGEMHQAPLEKLREVFECDAVLYLTINEFGSKYQVLSSNVIVRLSGTLVDARTGQTIWEGTTTAMSQGQSGLIEALVTQIINKMFDAAHNTAAMASVQLVMTPGQGMLKGPRHPEYGSD